MLRDVLAPEGDSGANRRERRRVTRRTLRVASRGIPVKDGGSGGARAALLRTVMGVDSRFVGASRVERPRLPPRASDSEVGATSRKPGGKHRVLAVVPRRRRRSDDWQCGRACSGAPAPYRSRTRTRPEAARPLRRDPGDQLPRFLRRTDERDAPLHAWAEGGVSSPPYVDADVGERCLGAREGGIGRGDTVPLEDEAGIRSPSTWRARNTSGRARGSPPPA
ncbi:hypothetical protein BV20DRAFT_743135 [Pilatotrama ljubarskyi]|nr:hypothetical protein BV20DRAFT_743135 [Pilatotrama ljubarskyi]